MDKDTHVSLHRSKMGRVDRMIKSGRFEDLYREFKAVAPSTQSEYFMMEAPSWAAPNTARKTATPPSDINGYPIMPPSSFGVLSSNPQYWLTTIHAKPPTRSNATLAARPMWGAVRP